MAKTHETPPKPKNPLKLVVPAEALSRFKAWLKEEFLHADSAAFAQQQAWKGALRRYAGIPEKPKRNIPIEDAPNLEVAIAAIAADNIYAQGVDLLESTTPLLTVTANARYKETLTEHAKDLQVFVNWLAPRVGIKVAIDHAWLDDTQLGTGIFYIPWIEETKKTRLGKASPRSRTLNRRPQVYPIPPEDIKVPGGKGIRNVEIQTAPWFGHRFYYSKHELLELQALKDWEMPVKPTPAPKDQVTFRRERYGKTSSSKKSELETLYEVWAVHVLYDLDGDGEREDLLVFYSAPDEHFYLIGYNGYDNRPYEKMVYQAKPHMFYGMGIPEMLAPFQDEITEIHNERNLNMKLANTRMWKGPPDAIEGTTMRVWPNRYIPTTDPAGLEPMQLSDIYPSSPQAEAITMALAERRVGINDMSASRPSQVLGSRTPGITAISMLNQINRRFTPAFTSLREAAGGAMKQCLFRVQERLLADDRDVEAMIIKVLGGEAAGRVIQILRDEKFDEAILVTLTASSDKNNKDVERQNAVVLVNLLSTYYEKALQLSVIAANPQTPPAVVEVATKIASAASEMIERTLRTFDTISDPDRFIIDMETTLDGLQVSQQGLSGLAQLLTAIPPATPANQGLG